ncbi:FAM151B isoform 5 [Pan troglodytes]|uniref:Family with sequence similarity 151 member B n=2 Tax=Homininae TaxID=207598 RepID=D6RD51_HUMAN|nr:family with sequence similarity 151 member B [Homo sapiens]KAI4021854.1 family with sequence similarity 151 member B [Homo sapiens]PNI73163.1 FAM151B isoform 5 [Pan troglodytes]
MAASAGGPGSWSENILEYFLRNSQITAEDGAEITWYHAANHKAQTNEALKKTRFHRVGQTGLELLTS